MFYFHSRYSILNFFQDIHVRISAFLQDKVQHNDGRFVISPPTVVYPGTDLPGTIKFMNSSGEVVETNKFYPGQEYRAQVEMLGLEVGAERSTSLGQNIYLGKCSGEPLVSTQTRVRLIITISLPHHTESIADPKSSDTARVSPLPQSSSNSQFPGREKDEARGELAKVGLCFTQYYDHFIGFLHFQEELNLLAKLIGTTKEVKKKELFKLNLFDTEVEFEASSEIDQQTSDFTAVSIDLHSSRKRGDIDKIITEMTITQEESEEDDLLALMDQAS